MNTNQFTYRDFVTYFLTGVIFILSFSILFSESVNQLTIDIFSKYKIVDEMKILVTIASIAIIYLIGHLVHLMDFCFAKVYVYLYQWNSKNQNTKIYRIRKFIGIIIHKQRVSYQIAMVKKQRLNLPYKNNEEFWEICAELQSENDFSSCEYWYSLNDLFKGLYLVFSFAMIFALQSCKIKLGICFLILGLMSYWRARQFAKYFVNTVIRNKKIKDKRGN